MYILCFLATGAHWNPAATTPKALVAVEPKSPAACHLLIDFQVGSQTD